LAARDHTIVVDVGLVVGGRERPDAQAGARGCARPVFFSIFAIPESVFSTFGVIRIGFECLCAEALIVTRFKIIRIAPLSVYRLLCLRIHCPG
jgi:hypothetical protein